MSALTQDVLRPVRTKLSAEQVQARRRQAEKVLGRKLPQDTAKAEADKQQQ